MSNTNSPPKSIHRVPLVPLKSLSALGGNEMPLWIKVLCICTIHFDVPIYLPGIRYDDGASWNEVATVPVVVCQRVRQAKRINRAPTEGFFNHRMYVWKVVVVGKGREA